MVLYSVTVSIAHSHEQEWQQWMREAHIPDVLKTGYFLKARMSKQLEPAPPEAHTSYQIVYECASLEDLEAYQEKAAPALQADHTERYQGHFQASRVILMSQQEFTPAG